MSFSKTSDFFSFCACIFGLCFVINNASYSSSKNRMPSAEEQEEQTAFSKRQLRELERAQKREIQNEALAIQINKSGIVDELDRLGFTQELYQLGFKGSIADKFEEIMAKRNEVRVPVLDKNGRRTSDFKITTWDAATVKEVDTLFKQDLNLGRTATREAKRFTGTHVGFAFAIHLVNSLKCTNNMFTVPVFGKASPSCGEDTLVNLLTDPLGIAGFYAFMVASSTTSGALINTHLKQIERIGLKKGLDVETRKANLKAFMSKNGVFKIAYGYIGMAVGSLTQDLLMDLIVESKPCVDSVGLGLGLSSAECSAFKAYMGNTEKWLEFTGSTTNMLSAAFAAWVVQTGFTKAFGPVLGRTMRGAGRLVFTGLVWSAGGGVGATFKIGKLAVEASKGVSFIVKPVIGTFSHAVWFISAEELFRKPILSWWYNKQHNKWKAGRKLDEILNEIETYKENQWRALNDKEAETNFTSLLKELNYQLKDSQEKSHLRWLNDEHLPGFHRKASQFYAAYEGTREFYSYLNEARSEKENKPALIPPEKVKWISDVVDRLDARLRVHTKNVQRTNDEKAKWGLESVKPWLVELRLCIDIENKRFDLDRYIKFRKDYYKLYRENRSEQQRISSLLAGYLSEVDNFVENYVTDDEGVLSYFYSKPEDEMSYYEIINSMSLGAPEGEKFIPWRGKSNTVLDGIILKSLCGDQDFELKDEESYSIKLTPAGVVDRSRAKFECDDPKYVYPLIPNRFKHDYEIKKDKLAALQQDFKLKIKPTHPRYKEMKSLMNKVVRKAEEINLRAKESSNSVSWFKVVSYTHHLKKLYKLINQKRMVDTNKVRSRKYVGLEAEPRALSIFEETGFTFQVRDLIKPVEKNTNAYQATAKHNLYSLYSPDDKPLVKDEYSALRFLLNPKVPLKAFIKSDLNIWWLKNVQKKALNSHLNMVAEYKHAIEEEVLSKNAVHLNHYISKAKNFSTAVENAAADLRSLVKSYNPPSVIKNSRGQVSNSRSVNEHEEAYRRQMTSKHYDLQMLARVRLYLETIEDIILAQMPKATTASAALQAALKEQIQIVYEDYSKLIVQISYTDGDVKASKGQVQDMINSLNAVLIANHETFKLPNSYEQFAEYSELRGRKANKDLLKRLGPLLTFGRGKKKAFVVRRDDEETAQWANYKASIDRAIRDHFSLYLQEVMLIDDSRKAQFRVSYVELATNFDDLLMIIRVSSVKNIDSVKTLLYLLEENLNDLNTFYNRYIEAFELLPHAGLAAISSK